MLFFVESQGQVKKVSAFSPNLKFNFELPNISFEDHLLINVQSADERVIYFFFELESGIVNIITVTKDFKVDSSSFQTDLFEEPFDILFFGGEYLILEGSKVIVISQKGKFKKSIDLDRKYDRFLSFENLLFIANSYNYANQESTSYISELTIKNGGQKVLIERENWDGREFSHFFHNWIVVDGSGFWIVEPSLFEISNYGLNGEPTKKYPIPGEFIRGNRDTIKNIYNKYPPANLKQAIIELDKYASNIDYVEQIFKIEESLLISTKIHGQGSSIRMVSKLSILNNELRLESHDTLCIGMFDENWLALNGDRYEYSFFPFHVNLARPFVSQDGYIYTALEMAFFPKKNLNSDEYIDGMQHYFENNSINYSILIYE